MHIPRAWLTLLKEKVQDCFGSALFVEATACVFMVCEPAREIVAPQQRRLNHRPCFELQAHAAFTIHVSDSFYEMPKTLRVHALQQEQHCLFLIEYQRIEGC